MNRRVIGLVLAIILAGIATWVLIQYVSTADERAREEETLAEVFVAQGDIPAGTSADDAFSQGLIATDEIPARTVPSGAVADPSQVSGQIATGPIFTGEVIVTQRFGSTVASGDATIEVPDGLQAVTVQAGVVPGVAGFVQPQDTVSVIATIELPEEDEEAPAAGDGDEAPPEDAEAISPGLRTQFLVQNAVVLAVGQRVITTNEDGSQSVSISRANDSYIFTLGLPPEEIEQLVFASQQGQLYYTLLPALEEGEEAEVFETPGRTIEDLFDN